MFHTRPLKLQNDSSTRWDSFCQGDQAASHDPLISPTIEGSDPAMQFDSRIEPKASSPTAWPFKVSASVGPRVIPLKGILTLQ